MKKFIIAHILILMSLLTTPIFSEEGSMIFRVAAFYPSSEKFREIYGSVNADYQLEANIPLPFFCMDGWANIDWIPVTGRSEGFKDYTRADIVNLSMGIKIPFHICDFTAYLGIGPSFGKIWIKNHSRCCHNNTTKYAIGGVIKSGLNYCINECIILDVFIDYLYEPVNFHKNIDIGGLKAGSGLAIVF